MHAWHGPDLPRLPGRGDPVRVRDSSSGGLVPAATGRLARMYVCGITPYDATHLGHAATYVAFDVLNRVWRDSGHEVRYVQNVTDIDDPLLDRAQRDGVDWAELAETDTELFRQDMAWLRVLPPEHFVGAVESLSLIIDLVDRLRAAGAAYEVDGDIYFPVQADGSFGAVSRLDRAEMLRLFPERGGDPERAGKKDPLDALLWRRERPGEPAWDSPFGRGRPGWHVECSAIALEYLGDAFDVQGGGSDLAFPHHEMSASHAQAAGHRPFARCYVHAGMVGLHGEKMSKSRGNLAFASQVRHAGVPGAAVRLALLAEHYRTDRDWTEALLEQAEGRLARWRAAATAPSGPDAGPVLAAVRSRLADDLDTPGAIAAIDEWAQRAQRDGGPDPDAPALVRDLADALLGIPLP